MLFKTPIEIESIEDVAPGTLVYLKGIVSNEKELSFGKTFLVDKIPIFCTCSKKYENKRVEILGIVENYYELRVKTLEIRVYPEEE